MSDTPRLSRIEAGVIAVWVFHQIEDLTTHGSVVGSLRRQEETVGDIDILVEVAPPFFENAAKIKSRILTKAKWHRGGDRMMVFRDVLGVDVHLDLFLCYPPRCYYSLLALRTGPKEDTQALVAGLEKNGYPRPHAEIPVRGEKELYELAGVEYVNPKERRRDV